jgi:hypothetical protein
MLECVWLQWQNEKEWDDPKNKVVWFRVKTWDRTVQCCLSYPSELEERGRQGTSLSWLSRNQTHLAENQEWMATAGQGYFYSWQSVKCSENETDERQNRECSSCNQSSRQPHHRPFSFSFRKERKKTHTVHTDRGIDHYDHHIYIDFYREYVLLPKFSIFVALVKLHF